MGIPGIGDDGVEDDQRYAAAAGNHDPECVVRTLNRKRRQIPAKQQCCSSIMVLDQNPTWSKRFVSISNWYGRHN